MSLRSHAILAIFAVLITLNPVHATNQNQAIGTGINSIRNWAPSVPFVDLFKSAAEFPDTTGVSYDAQGWPQGLPAGTSVRTTVINPSLTPALPAGDYVIRYDGEGIINYDGSHTQITKGAGRDVLTIDPQVQKAYLQIIIEESDPLNPIRNIQVTLPGGICADNPTTRVDNATDCSGNYLAFEDYSADILFNPAFLDFVKDFRVLRYMDFMETNGSPVKIWDDRTKLDDAVWSGESGAPIEIMVELANRADANPWFNIPHLADDNYVQEFARYVHGKLNTNLTAYIEYTNEAWANNVQGVYIKNMGQTLGLDPNYNAGGGKYYAQRSVEIFDLWETEFGGLDRITRVLSGQIVNTWITGIILNHENAYEHADVFGVNAYVSGDINYFRDEAVTIDDIFAEMRNPDSLKKTTLPKQVENIKAQIAIVNPLGLELVAFEGGQGLVDFVTTSNDQHPNPLFYAANRDAEMAVIYGEILNEWKDAGGTLFVHYTAPSIYNKFGSWGVQEYTGQPRIEAPKYDALLNFLAVTPCWWTNCIGSPAGNVVPDASFNMTNNELELSVDGSTSSDADGTINSYLWNFGDNTTASGVTASHTYTQAGDYSVTLVVIDNDNNSSLLTQQVSISASQLQQTPVANLAITINGLTIDVDGTASTDADGSITSYDWDFGDSNTGSGEITSHTYATGGDYSVTLTVTDDSSLSNVSTQTVSVSPNVTPLPPVAAFTLTQTDLTVAVDASDSTDDNGINAYNWDFGDGNTATGDTASHTYATAGSYTISLTLTDNDGLTDRSDTIITITAPVVQNQSPQATFTTLETGLDITVDGSGSSDTDGSISNYDWDFDDGTTATGAIVTHSYTTDGNYNVRLTVTDDAGATNTSSMTVTVAAINIVNPPSIADSGGGGGIGLMWLLLLGLISYRELKPPPSFKPTA